MILNGDPGATQRMFRSLRRSLTRDLKPIPDLDKARTAQLPVPIGTIGPPSCDLVDSAWTMVLLRRPQRRVDEASVMQPLRGDGQQGAPCSHAPAGRLNVEAVELAGRVARVLVAGGAGDGEADHSS